VLSLSELQAAFSRGVLDPADAEIAESIVAAGMPAASRMAVYRGNLDANYTGTLREVYPVSLRLVGEGFFDALARAYARQVPSRSGDLHDFGEELPGFLEGFAPARGLPYLPDVARLEWAVHRVFHARAAARIDPAELAAVPPERLADVCFELSPAARLLRSAYPVLTIWRVNQPDYAGDQTVDLSLGTQCVLVIRRDLDVALEPLADADYANLDSLHRGRGLEHALAAAQRADPDFDLERFLAAHVLGGTFGRLIA
jgi:hypothetical protein